jgi:hypothetical protein
MDSLWKALADESFIRGLLLLLITAGLTGLLVPYIKGRMDDKKYRQQKLFEAQLARQSKIIEAQVALIENLSQLLWEFQYSCLEVSYYGQGPDKGRYEKAIIKYDEQSWILMTKIGTEIGKAQRLVSDETYQKLKDFYYRWMVSVDNKIEHLERVKASEKEWAAHHKSVFKDGAEKIEGVLAVLARELRLEGQLSEPAGQSRFLVEREQRLLTATEKTG